MSETGRNGATRRVTGLRVLFVEDEPHTREITAMLMTSLGHDVTTCGNGAEALAISQADARPFDVVVLDVQMPVMDGLEATRRLRADPRTAEVPILSVSARASATTREEVLNAGSDAYLTKPIAQASVFDAITQVLRRRGRLGPDECFG